MRKKLIFIGIIVIIIFVGIFGYKNLTKNEQITQEINMSKETLTGKRAVMVVAFKNFRDEEYFVPKEILEQAGVEVKTASNQKGIAIGDDGGEAKVDFLISEINLANTGDATEAPSHLSSNPASPDFNFDALVFVGGPGCLENLDNEDSYRLAQETVFQDKILASICISPVILAKAGVLKGKKATVWSSPINKESIKILEENGAIYQDKSTVIDGKIITANGPAAAKEFGEIIVRLLTSN